MAKPYWNWISAVAVVVIALTVGTNANVLADDTDANSAKTVVEEKGEANDDGERSEKEMTIYEFKANSLEGKPVDFDKYKGHVVLIVNTASECGYTPQYEGLEELHKKYSAKGLDVLGFPCNQFGGQEPGDAEKIGAFCKKNYGVDFQIFEKIDVNGPNAHPLYRFLTKDDAIKWNFTKFLINKNGEVVQRYESKVKPAEIEADIEKLL